MSWQGYREHLERNARRSIPETEGPSGLSKAQHSKLLRSLQKFQLGESGEGRIANEIDRVNWPSVDDTFRQVVKLWVREEGRHARVLGLMVAALGGRVLSRDWSAKGFEVARRAMGPKWKLLIALAAEVAGMVFYRLLASVLPPSKMALALHELSADEAMHLEFQSELFRRMSHGFFSQLFIRAGWLFAGGGACCVVLIEHSGTLGSFGCPRRTLSAELWRAFWDVWRRIGVREVAAAPTVQLAS